MFFNNSLSQYIAWFSENTFRRIFVFGQIFDNGRKDFLNDTHRYFALLFELCCEFLLLLLGENFDWNEMIWYRMVICGHRLNRHVLDRQCKDYSRQHQLVQQILILQFSPHYHYHHLVGHFHQHLLIWILIHLYGRRITEYMPNSTSKINEKFRKPVFCR